MPYATLSSSSSNPLTCTFFLQNILAFAVDNLLDYVRISRTHSSWRKTFLDHIDEAQVRGFFSQEKGTSQFANNRTFFEKAVKEGNTEFFQTILYICYTNSLYHLLFSNPRLLSMACQNRNYFDLPQLLLTAFQGEPPKQKGNIYIQIKNIPWDHQQTLLKEALADHGHSALYWAATNGNLDAVQRLLKTYRAFNDEDFFLGKALDVSWHGAIRASLEGRHLNVFKLLLNAYKQLSNEGSLLVYMLNMHDHLVIRLAARNGIEWVTLVWEAYLETNSPSLTTLARAAIRRMPDLPNRSEILDVLVEPGSSGMAFSQSTARLRFTATKKGQTQTTDQTDAGCHCVIA